MSKLQLTFACLPYDRVQPLMTGEVQIEGVELTPITLRWPTELFSRMIAHQEFDIAEMSFTHCIVLRERGETGFVTLPIYPSRMFRHGFIFVNEKSGIRTPKDLEGRRIGTQGHQATAAIWIRGLLQQEYGVDFDGVQWLEGGVNQKGVAGGHVTMMRPDAKLAISHIGPDRMLSDLLAAGEIDALLGPEIPNCFFTSPDVKRLFPDYHKLERAYYEKTGIFPIMHALVVKKEIYERHPWLATSLFKACQQAKRLAWKQAQFTGAMSYMMPWMYEQLEEVHTVFGQDPWPYGVESSRKTIEAYLRMLHHQKFIRTIPRIEDLFVPVIEAVA